MNPRQASHLSRRARPPRFGPFLVVVVYLLVSLIYVPTSDWALEVFVADPAMVAQLQTAKGLVFVSATGVMLYFLVWAAVRRERAYHHELEAGSDEIRRITASVPGVVLQARIDTAGAWTFPFVSDAIEQLSGLTPGAIYADPQAMFSVIAPEDLPELFACAEESRRTLSARPHEFRIITLGGATKWIRSQSVASRDSSGAVILHSVLTDITNARRDQSQREGQSAVLRLLIAGESTERVLDAVVRLAEEQAPEQRCAIYIADDSAPLLRLAAAPSLAPQWNSAQTTIPIRPGSGACGAAAFHGRSVVCETVAGDALFLGLHDLAETSDIRACCATPVFRSDGVLLGAVCMTYTQPRSPTDQEREIISLTTKLAAIVIGQRRSEAALRSSETRYRQIVESAHEGIWLFDNDWNTTFVNQRMASMLGRAPQDMIGHSVFEYVEPGQEDQIRASITPNGASGLEAKDIRFLRADHTELWTLFSATPAASGDILGSTGADFWNSDRPDSSDEVGAGGVLAMVTDITDRKAAEDSLRQSEERFRLMVSQSHVVIWQAELPTFRFTYVSQFAQTLLGYELHEWREPDFWSRILHPQDRDRVLNGCIQNAQGEQDHVCEFRVRARDGRELWIRNFVGLFIEDGQPVRLRGAFTDITAERRAQEELRESEARYRSIIEDQTELICRFGSDGAITFANDAFCRFFNIDPGAGRDHSAWRLIGDRSQILLRQMLRSLTRRAPVGFFEQVIERPDAEPQCIAWTCRVLFDDERDTARYQAVGADITALKAAQNELLAINQRQTLLLDELDHRVKNSLAGLLSLVALSEPDAGGDGVSELAISIRARVEAMAAAHSLLSSNHWRSVPLESLLQRLIPPDLTVGRVVLSGPQIEIPARQVTALGMILQELMTNSAKYGALALDPGVVTVRWETDAADADHTLTLRMYWSETGGPPITAEPRPRLGVSLIQGFARTELGGDAKLTFAAQGVRHELTLRLDPAATTAPQVVNGSRAIAD